MHFLSFLFFLATQVSPAPSVKLAPSLFHFNVQYVAGDSVLEHRVLTDSLYPLLQVISSMPEAVVDVEIQAYGLEMMEKDHPEILALLKDLIDKGKVELVVSHYSDQLFIGYPAIDMIRSLELSTRICDRLGLKRSKIFCGQEIQWAPGLPCVLGDGWDTVAITGAPIGHFVDFPSVLGKVSGCGEEKWVLMSGDGSLPNGPSWQWAFFDDGETFNTLTTVNDFIFVPVLQAARANSLVKLQQEGYRLCSITELAQTLLKSGPPAELPFVPEGTWRMGEGRGPYNWMGKLGSPYEDDGRVRALPYQARGLVLASEALAKAAGAEEELKPTIEEAWKKLLLAEVSDSSGWAPRPVEVNSTGIQCEKTQTLCMEALGFCWEKLQPSGPLYLDTQAGLQDKPWSSFAARESAPPPPFTLRKGKGDPQCRPVGEGIYEIQVTLQPEKDGKRQAVEIAFPVKGDTVAYSPSLDEESSVTLTKNLKNDPYLPLSNGWIYTGQESVIKDCSVSHLTCKWSREENIIVFREELRNKDCTSVFRFLIVSGPPERGHLVAQRLNVWPRYTLSMKDGKLDVAKETVPLEP